MTRKSPKPEPPELHEGESLESEEDNQGFVTKLSLKNWENWCLSQGGGRSPAPRPPPPRKKRAHPGRTPKPFWPKMYIAGKKELDGYKHPIVQGDGKQAKLENYIGELIAEDGEYAAEASIRTHVERMINAWPKVYKSTKKPPRKYFKKNF